MEKSFPFNSINGDRKYNTDDWREYFASFIENGIFPNPASNLEVVPDTGMNIIVKPGKGWIFGARYLNTDNKVMHIDAAHGILNRVDRVVLRLDNYRRDITCNIVKGISSSNPVTPSLQRNADVYELGLATIRVNAGATSIHRSNITDTRLNTEVCGIVNSLIKVDSTIITEKFETDFYSWFDTIKGILDEDVAGALMNEILKVEERVKTNEKSIKDLQNDLGSNIATLENNINAIREVL